MMKRIIYFGKQEPPIQSASLASDSISRSSSPSGGSGGGYKVRIEDLPKLHRAAATGDLQKMQKLVKRHDISKQDEAKRTPLHLACADGHTDVVTFLVDEGCKIDVCDIDKMSPLVKDGNTPLLVAAAENDQSMVEFLLKNGADVHARNNEGSLKETITEYANLSNVKKSSSKSKGLPEDDGFIWGAPATNEEVVDEHSSVNLVSEPGKTGNNSWLTSGKEELGLSSKDTYEEESSGEEEAGHVLAKRVICHKHEQNLNDLIEQMIKILETDSEDEDKTSESSCNSKSISENPRKPTCHLLPTSPTRTTMHVHHISEQPCDDPSYSKSPKDCCKTSPCANSPNSLMLKDHASLEQLAKSEAATETSEIIPVGEEELSGPQTIIASKALQMESCSLKYNYEEGQLRHPLQVCCGCASLIVHKKGLSARLLQKVKELETEKREVLRMVEEMREEKAVQDIQKAEWNCTIRSLKLSLKQEKEQRMYAEEMVEKNKEYIRKKEEHYSKKVEGKWQLKSLLRQLKTRMADIHEREKELLHKNKMLQQELLILRLELDQIRAQHEEEKAHYRNENETLKTTTEELKKKMKINEALTETVLLYNEPIYVSKTETATLSSRLDHVKKDKERMEVDADLCPCLSYTIPERKPCQLSKTDCEQMQQRENDHWLCFLEKEKGHLCKLQETNNAMSQHLSEAEGTAHCLESELHHGTQAGREKTLKTASNEWALSQVHCKAKELENALQVENDQLNKYLVKEDLVQEHNAQVQSENHRLQQQEYYQSKGVTKENVVTDIYDRCNDVYSDHKADTDRQVQMMEERNKELIATCNNLREQISMYEMEKLERKLHNERKKAKKLEKLNQSAAMRLDKEITRNCELRKESQEMKKLLKECESKESLPQISSKGEIRDRCSEIVGKLQIKVDELSHHMDAETKKHMQLESTHHDRQYQLSSMEKSLLCLETEVAKVRCLTQNNLKNQHQMKQFKRDVDAQARQERRQKLGQINVVLQITAAENASVRLQQEERFRQQESELARLKSNQQDNIFQIGFIRRETERYKSLYLEEQERRKSLESKLDQCRWN